MNQTDKVLFEIDNRGVATVTLNQPDIHNAFDDKLIVQLTDIFSRINQNNDIRVMVLAAAGKSFSAGADLNWMQRMATYSYEQNLADANALAKMFYILNTIDKPTIARVQGAAFGGAVGLVACCDMAIGSKLSKFCLSEVKLGLVPATISPYVIDALGARIARRYFATAEVFSATRARRLGLLSEAVVEEELDSTIENLIEHILKNSPAAIRAAKQLIFEVQDRPICDDLIAKTSEKIAELRVSEQGQEGLNAFLQKRRANWVTE
ncbi:enoyl-CoA hydratase/isomerase family protein [uncultured Paraglaciecola sp.]|uniref:enoyl-CoA hydratase/isomerase family protein n=1 Tax=uncultured Paraglaciecola sp. TaxID=1765024 RepID=UPI0030D7B285|tara:strand:- start:11929 stop:12723 length:795 start_codon:yes stop_codon:yes gene_type:complete